MKISSSATASRAAVSLLQVTCILLALLMAGCGNVEWFPPFVRLATTPDPFSFPSKTGTAVSSDITSDPITVSGISADSSPISVIGSVGSNSKYSINSGTPTDSAGTVKNGDKVTVTHTSSSSLGAATTSTLSIGNVTGTFISTTQLVNPLVFTSPIHIGTTVMQAQATIISFDGTVGTHVISIKDSLNSGNATFSISDANLNPTTFTNLTQTIPVLNTKIIFVRNLVSTILTPATTTLTIDGVDFTVNLTPP